jgi:uncharacterized protein
MKTQTTLIIALLMASSVAHATSFNCAKASTYVEKAICSDATLGKLDDALTQNYNAMRASDLDDGAALKKEQRAWIAQRNKCATDQCLVDLYRKRIDAVCDAPVVNGVHAACMQSSDIDETPATTATQGASQAGTSNFAIAQSARGPTFGFKEYVIGQSKANLNLVRCAKIVDTRDDLEMCLPTNVSVTIAGIPGQIKLLAFKDHKLESVEVDVRTSEENMSAINSALTGKYGEAAERRSASSRWVAGENQIDSKSYPGGVSAIMFFNTKVNREIINAQKHEKDEKENSARKQSANDL